MGHMKEGHMNEDLLQASYCIPRKNLHSSNRRQKLLQFKDFYKSIQGGDKVNEGHKEGKLGDLYWGPSTICTKVVSCYLQNTELSEWHL